MAFDSEQKKLPQQWMIDAAVGWFTMLGFVVVVAVFEGVRSVSDNAVVEMATGLSYVMLWLWLWAKTNHAMWRAVPFWSPRTQAEERKLLRYLVRTLGGFVAGVVIWVAYDLLTALIPQIVSTSACAPT